MPKPCVVLFGEVLVDMFPDRQVLGGAPFNVARHLQAFGLHPVLISRLGDDALRAQVLQAMSRYGMDASGMQTDPEHPTGRVQVHLKEGGGHNFEILPQQAYDFINADIARQVMQSLQPDLVYFGTLAQRHGASRAALEAMLADCGALRLLDLNLRPPWYDLRILHDSLQRCDVVKMNEEELDALAVLMELQGNDMPARAASLIDRFSLQQVVVTCGGSGAWLFDTKAQSCHLQGDAVDADGVVDTVGAGDGFSSVLILGTVRGWPLELSMARANAFAAAVCGMRGAVPEDEGFYTPFLREWFQDE